MTKRLTPFEREQIVELYNRNRRLWSQKQLAHQFGVSTTTISCVLDPAQAERKRERLKAWHRRNAEDLRARNNAGLDGVQHAEVRARIEADARAHLKNLPDDTRTTTQRFFGDPLPGRSALDRRAEP